MFALVFSGAAKALCGQLNGTLDCVRIPLSTAKRERLPRNAYRLWLKEEVI
jgi:hypothetical protein